MKLIKIRGSITDSGREYELAGNIKTAFQNSGEFSGTLRGIPGICREQRIKGMFKSGGLERLIFITFPPANTSENLCFGLHKKEALGEEELYCGVWNSLPYTIFEGKLAYLLEEIDSPFLPGKYRTGNAKIYIKKHS